MDKTTVSAHLILAGDSFDIDYVTGVLGIHPTIVRRKGEVLHNGRLFESTIWGIGTEYEISRDIASQYSKILHAVQEKTELLARICTECQAEWYIDFVIYIENGINPAMHLSKEIVSFAGAIGAQIDFDMYILSMLDENA